MLTESETKLQKQKDRTKDLLQIGRATNMWDRHPSPHPLTHLRHIGIPVFGHPGGPRQQGVVALHVQQGHGAAHSSEQVGPPHQHVAHQQAAVGTTTDACSATTIKNGATV